MKYPLELKQKVLKDYFDGNDGIRGLERIYGIPHQLILSWIKHCRQPSSHLRLSKIPKEAAKHLQVPPTFEDPRKELEYLRTENAYLCEMLALSGVRKNGRKKKRFEAIRRLQSQGFAVSLLCSIAQVSRSGYYRYLQAVLKPDKDILLVASIRHIQEQVRFSYGAKRMAHMLSRLLNRAVNHKRVARIMREYLLGARIRLRRHPEYWYRQRRAVRLSDRQCAPNILNRDFHAASPLEKLVTDVTWITCADGILYLSAVMDLFNRQIVSFTLSRRNTTETAIRPLLKLAASYNLQGVLMHCDRGPAYRSEAYQAVLQTHGMVASYSRAGNCWDNALMENFFGHMKCECGFIAGNHKKHSMRQAAHEIHDYLEFYNKTRIQKNLGWVSPVDYAKLHGSSYTISINVNNVST